MGAFLAGEACISMLFIVKGLLTYTLGVVVADSEMDMFASDHSRSTTLNREISDSSCNAAAEVNLSDRARCCEAVLWARWKTCGSLRAVRCSLVLAMNAESFRNITKLFDPVHAACARYAVCFAKYVNSIEATDLTEFDPSMITISEDMP